MHMASSLEAIWIKQAILGIFFSNLSDYCLRLIVFYPKNVSPFLYTFLFSAFAHYSLSALQKITSLYQHSEWVNKTSLWWRKWEVRQGAVGNKKTLKEQNCSFEALKRMFETQEVLSSKDCDLFISSSLSKNVIFGIKMVSIHATI